MTIMQRESLLHITCGLVWALLLLLIEIYPSASAQTRQRSYTISPSSVEQGKEYELTIRSVNCASNDLMGTDLVAPAGSGISVAIATGVHDCTMIARILVARDAPVDTVPLRIMKGGSVWGLVDLPVRRNVTPEPTTVPSQPSLPTQPAPGPVSTSSKTKFGDETPRVEVFGGYSFARVDLNGGHVNANGWMASVAGNLNRYFGIVGEVSGHYKTILLSGSAYTFLGGPRVYARNRVATVFGHGLFGVSHAGVNFLGLSLAGETAFAAAVGGGVDINVHRNFAVRAIQADYVLTRFRDVFGERRTQNNLRLSVGAVFRFGK